MKNNPFYINQSNGKTFDLNYYDCWKITVALLLKQIQWRSELWTVILLSHFKNQVNVNNDLDRLISPSKTCLSLQLSNHISYIDSVFGHSQSKIHVDMEWKQLKYIRQSISYMLSSFVVPLSAQSGYLDLCLKGVD